MRRQINQAVTDRPVITGSNITVQWTLPKFLLQLQRVTGVTSMNPIDHLIFVRVLMANVLVYEDALRSIDPNHPLLPHILDPVDASTATAAVLPRPSRVGRQ